MQKAISFLLIGAAIMSVFLCACDSQTGEEESTDNNDKIIAVTDKSTPITKGNLITKTKAADDGIVVEFYDSNSNLVEEFVWADEETQKQHTVYTYTSNNQISTQTELTQNGKHMITTMYQYNSDTTLLQKTISEYEDGLMTKATTYNADDEITGYSVSKYNDNGRLIRIDRFDEANDLVEYFMYEYDDSGRTSRYASYTAADELKQYSTFSYGENGKLAEEKYYSGDDTLEHYYKFDYYASGAKKESTHYDADGSILSQDFFEDETAVQ